MTMREKSGSTSRKAHDCHDPRSRLVTGGHGAPEDFVSHEHPIEGVFRDQILAGALPPAPGRRDADTSPTPTTGM